MNYDVIIIGGGMSGVICGTRLASARVLLLESNDRLLKKIHATGNGRCNLTNKQLSAEAYQTDCPQRVEKILKAHDNEDLLDFFDALGLSTVCLAGCYYPRNLSADTVVDFLYRALLKAGVTVRTNEGVIRLSQAADGYLVTTSVAQYTAPVVVMAAGSKASGFNRLPVSPYELIPVPTAPPLPALCPLVSDRKYFKRVRGVRVRAALTLYVDDTVLGTEQGIVQMTAEGLSGIAVFQLAGRAARALAAGRNVTVALNYIHDLNPEAVREQLSGTADIGFALTGYLPKKLADLMMYMTDRKEQKMEERLARLMTLLQNHRVPIVRTADYAAAQTCTGGILMAAMDDHLSVEGWPGLYVCGELLNVDGICGGYNIQWAYSSAARVADALNQRK